MKVESLLIDIETLLKMVRFVPSFHDLFVNIKYLELKEQQEIVKYVENANILSKELLWDFCCVLDHVIEINKVINEWRNGNENFKQLEADIKNTPEKKYTHDIIGKIIQSNKYKELMQELGKNGFYYNGMAIISSSINNANGNLHFFY